ncbi:MAG: nucleotidyltransferase domain-containing protein [Cyclobacteriaceae bacterium]
MKTEDSITQKVKEAVRSLDPEAEVVLFGSRARGDSHEESDWDFLVLSKKISTRDEKRKFYDTMLDIELATGEVLSFFINEPSAWHRKEGWPIHNEVTQDGILL